MTCAVFVHGNPETTAIWDPLLQVLDHEEVETISPPGFGSPAPDDFAASVDDYVAWLIGQLEGRPEPVDLVGHDWGGGHVARVAVERPDLLRSWVIDIGGCFAPDYVWHDNAREWQAPGVGEDAIASLLELPAPARASFYEAIGMTPVVARQVAEAFDETMGRCILALYRSAAQPLMARLGGRLRAAAARPGLVVIATEDGYTGGERRARWAAEQAHAQVALLPGLGHWWMLQDPQAGADALRAFWSSVDHGPG